MPGLTEEILLLLHEGLYLLRDPHPHFPPSAGALGYRPASYYKTVERLEKRGMLRKTRRERKLFLSLTEQGKHAVEKHRRAARTRRQPWDGKWRLVAFDVPEKQAAGRNYLRAYLKKLGFGKVQRSIWLSPYDFQPRISSFAGKMKIADYVLQMTVESFSGKTDRELVGSVWPIPKIQLQYKNLAKRYSEQLELAARDGIKMDEESRKGWRRLLHNLVWDYQSILALDPQLPPSLLPSDWAQDSVRALIRNLESLSGTRVTVI